MSSDIQYDNIIYDFITYLKNKDIIVDYNNNILNVFIKTQYDDYNFKLHIRKNKKNNLYIEYKYDKNKCKITVRKKLINKKNYINIYRDIEIIKQSYIKTDLEIIENNNDVEKYCSTITSYYKKDNNNVYAYVNKFEGYIRIYVYIYSSEINKSLSIIYKNNKYYLYNKVETYNNKILIE